VGSGSTAVCVQHDQYVLRVPVPQLARRFPGLPSFGGPIWLTTVGSVGSEMSTIMMPALLTLFIFAVGPASDVRVVAVDRKGRVHPAMAERVRPDEVESGSGSGGIGVHP
jgi:hypothetical protein